MLTTPALRLDTMARENGGGRRPPAPIAAVRRPGADAAGVVPAAQVGRGSAAAEAQQPAQPRQVGAAGGQRGGGGRGAADDGGEGGDGGDGVPATLPACRGDPHHVRRPAPTHPPPFSFCGSCRSGRVAGASTEGLDMQHGGAAALAGSSACCGSSLAQSGPLWRHGLRRRRP